MKNKIETKSIDNYLVCTECCQKIQSIFKIYSDGFKDIIECVRPLLKFSTEFNFILNFNLFKSKCGNLVDTYVECEYSVILVDLILFKDQAYRHIIINNKIKVCFFL
jgi:hypothetical protein